jgi:hypothetical protein
MLLVSVARGRGAPLLAFVPREGDFIFPRQRWTVTEHLLIDDPPAWLNRDVAASAEFSHQR